jgi:hypothetical protein
MPGSGFNRVGSATRTTFTATVSPLLNFPTGVAAGDFLVAFIGSATTYTLSSTTGWNLIGTKQDAAGSDSSYTLLWRYHTSGSSWTFTNLFTGSQIGAGVIVAWNKTNTGTTPIHKYAQAASGLNATSLSGPSITTTLPRCLIVQFAGCDPSTSAYAGTPDTSPVAQELYDSKDAGNNTYIYIQSYLLQNPGALALDVTGLTADNYAYFQIAIMAPFPFVTGLTLTVGRTPPTATAGSSPPATTRLATGSVGAPRGGGGHGPLGRYSTAAVGTVVAIGAFDATIAITGQSASSSLTIPARSGDANTSISGRQAASSFTTAVAVGGSDASVAISGRWGSAYATSLPSVATGLIQPVAKANLVDGETVTISDGVTTKTFEFDTDDSVTLGNVQIDISGISDAFPIGMALLDAIIAQLNITGDVGFPIVQMHLANEGIGTVGNVEITDTVDSAGFFSLGMSGGRNAASGTANVLPLGLQLTLSRGLLITSGAVETSLTGVEATAGNGSVATGPLLVGRSTTASSGSINIWPILQGQDVTGSIGSPLWTLLFSGVNATFWFGYPVASIIGIQAEALPVGVFATAKANPPFGILSLWEVGAYVYIAGLPGTGDASVAASTRLLTTGRGIPIAKSGAKAAPEGVSSTAARGAIGVIGSNNVLLLGRSCSSGYGAVTASSAPAAAVGGVSATGSVGPFVHTSAWDVGAYIYGSGVVYGSANIPIAGVQATASKGAFGAAPVGVFATASVGEVLAVAGPQVLLTGVETVAAVGTLAVGGYSAVTIAGVEATSGIPSKTEIIVTASSSKDITGVEVASAFGTLLIASDAESVIEGVEVVGTVGTVSAQGGMDVAVAGLEATSAVPATLEASAGSTVPLTGIALVSAVTALSAEASVDVLPTGVFATAAVGEVTVDVSTDLIGVSAQGSRGVVSASTAPTYGQGFAVGQQLTSAVGTVTCIANSTKALTGRGLTSSISIPTVSSTTGVIPAGLQLTLTRGAIAAGQVLAGVSATGAVGTSKPSLHIEGLTLTAALGTPVRSGDAIRGITGVYCTAARTAPRADVEFEIEGVTAAGYADNLPASGDARITLDAVNVQATAYIGDIIATGTILGEAAVLGKSAAASVGTVHGTAGSIIGIEGTTATSAIGDIILGVGMTVAIDAINVQSVAAVGDVVATSDAAVALTGRSVTGVLGPTAGLGGGTAIISINTGLKVTAACGDVVARCNAAALLTGLAVIAYPGSVRGEMPGTVAPDGVEGTVAVGDVIAIGWAAADGVAPILGVSATGSRGTLAFAYAVQALPAGVEVVSGLGTLVADVIGIRKNGDTYTEAFTTPATTFTTGAITVAAGRNSVMVVSIVVNSTGTLTNPCITAIKWGGSGGVALTRAGYVPNDHSRETGLWYLVAPTVQTSTLYVTTADSVACSLVMTVFDHASQYGNPFRSVNTTTGYSKSAQVSVYAQPGDLLIDAFMGGSTQTVTCMQTLDGSVTNSASLASRCAMSHAGMN